MDDWWIQQLDRFRRESQLSDVAVAKRLDISPAMLAHVRTGRRLLPLQARIRLLDALGYVITRKLLLRVVPEEVRQALVAANAALIEANLAEGAADPNADLEMPPEWH